MWAQPVSLLLCLMAKRQRQSQHKSTSPKKEKTLENGTVSNLILPAGPAIAHTDKALGRMGDTLYVHDRQMHGTNNPHLPGMVSYLRHFLPSLRTLNDSPAQIKLCCPFSAPVAQASKLYLSYGWHLQFCLFSSTGLYRHRFEYVSLLNHNKRYIAEPVYLQTNLSHKTTPGVSKETVCGGRI